MRLESRMATMLSAMARPEGQQITRLEQARNCRKARLLRRRSEDLVGHDHRSSVLPSKGAVGMLTCPSARTDYDEEVEGFAFTRTRSKKPRNSISKVATVPESVPEMPSQAKSSQPDQRDDSQDSQQKKRRRNKMSFSTPRAAEKPAEKPKRRSSRRTSWEVTADEDKAQQGRLEETTANAPVVKRKKTPPRVKTKDEHVERPMGTHADQPIEEPTMPSLEVTKIALPFADTPVICRNKAMRQGQDGKGERRSSLGMRGRRASSLIDSGNSSGTNKSFFAKAVH